MFIILFGMALFLAGFILYTANEIINTTCEEETSADVVRSVAYFPNQEVIEYGVMYKKADVRPARRCTRDEILAWLSNVNQVNEVRMRAST